jgi:hypothetical protein
MDVPLISDFSLFERQPLMPKKSVFSITGDRWNCRHPSLWEISCEFVRFSHWHDYVRFSRWQSAFLGHHISVTFEPGSGLSPIGGQTLIGTGWIEIVSCIG